MSNNYERMLELAKTIFDVHNDPDQLDVDEAVLLGLRKLHPDTVQEASDANGPIAWVLLIPTTKALMEQFLAGDITERELYTSTHTGKGFEAVYLCSGIVLEEYRRQGIAKRLAHAAIKAIQRDHPIRSLFVWTFSEAGRESAQAIADLCALPLFKR